MNELKQLKQRYQKRLDNLKPRRIDQEAEIVLKQIDDVEALLAELAQLRKELYNEYEKDYFGSPGSMMLVSDIRKDIRNTKHRIRTLGFEQYITPDTIDSE